MKAVTRSAHNGLQLAQTQVYHLLDNQLILILRAWGSSEYNQKFVDEVTHYISSTQADLEVTTPFDYHEGLTTLANRTRVALLLAHDLFCKNDNKNDYSVGFEATVLFRSKTEIAWSSVGRFSLHKISGNTVNRILHSGTDLDGETLLPVQLIGVERDMDMMSGSVSLTQESKLVVSSCYNCDVVIEVDENGASAIGVSGAGSYWFAEVAVG